jgi:hypothetical protein
MPVGAEGERVDRGRVAAEGRQGLLRMEFKRFLQEVVLLPCQVVRAGRRLVYRLLQWNPWVDVLGRAAEVVRRLRFG